MFKPVSLRFRIQMLLIYFTPTLLCAFNIFSKETSNYFWTFLLLAGAFLILVNVFLISFQIISAFGWLYPERKEETRFIILVTPFIVFFNDKVGKTRLFESHQKLKHILIGFTLYLLTFSNIYQYLSWLEMKYHIQSFSSPNLNFIDSLYFTSVTSATIGYGDLVPKSDSAKLLVTIQIWTTFTYVIAIFSNLSNIFKTIWSKE